MRITSFRSTLAPCLVYLLFSIGVEAGTLHRRVTIDHDKVVGFPETVPNDAAGAAPTKFKPFLKVQNGCVPFPAVDAQGNTGGGLNPSGESSSGCDSSTGQIYARSADHNGRFAIMYAWYFPKDSPATELGHRHDWESTVVWLANSTSQDVLAVAPSAHGGFDPKTPPDFTLDGSRPLIQYFSIFPVDHQLGVTSDKGGEQPLIAWESMTDAARSALSTTSFGAANVPFIDSNFNANLDKASF